MHFFKQLLALRNARAMYKALSVQALRTTCIVQWRSGRDVVLAAANLTADPSDKPHDSENGTWIDDTYDEEKDKRLSKAVSRCSVMLSRRQAAKCQQYAYRNETNEKLLV